MLVSWMGDDLHVVKDVIPELLDYVKNTSNANWLQSLFAGFADVSEFGRGRTLRINEAADIANDALREAFANRNNLRLENAQTEPNGEYTYSEYNLKTDFLNRAEQKWRESHKNDTDFGDALTVFNRKFNLLVERMRELPSLAIKKEKEDKQTATIK